MVTVKNLLNSPDDLQAIGGLVRIPALGSIEADFAPEYLVALKGCGMFEVSDEPISPLDHDRDGHLGGVVDPSPLTDAEKLELLDAMTDEEIREFITQRDGKAPHPRMGRDKLLAKARGE